MQSDDLTTQSTEWLVRFALQCDDDNPQRWDAIRVLQDRGSREVFDAAKQLCTSAHPGERCLGVDILAQGRAESKTFHDEAIAALLQMLEHEDDSGVLYSVAMALGHRKDARAIEPLSALSRHPNPNVRYGVAFGLLGEEDERAIQTLIELSADEDSEVRDWATFGLGSQIASDTPALREALAARLTDSDSNTHAEAIVGLALRHDVRAVPALVKVIQEGWDGPLIREAVEALPHPDVLAALSGARDSMNEEAQAWAASVLSDTR